MPTNHNLLQLCASYGGTTTSTITTKTTNVNKKIKRMNKEISYDGSLVSRVILLLVIGMQTLLTIVFDHVDDFAPPRPSEREPSILA